VQPGEIVGFLGPNGAGKSTTMRMLTGYLPPTSGSASISGHDVFEDSLKARREIGFMPENVPLYEDMRVMEYLSFRAALKGVKIREVRRSVERAMEYCGLGEVRKKMIGTLSKGFRQRVGLADALVHRPRLLILDEPTNGLDPTQIFEIRALIQRLAENSTVIVSTHILSEVEATCHRAIIIMNGAIKTDAKLADLKQSSTARAKIAAGATGVAEALRGLPGVTEVAREGDTGAWERWRVVGAKDSELCPLIFDLAKERGYRLGELTQATKTLESVFRELADKEGVRA
jgi:ABC-2 type transport system ATP-binding protein